MIRKDHHKELAILHTSGYTGLPNENANPHPHDPDTDTDTDTDETASHMADIVEHWYLTGETPL